MIFQEFQSEIHQVVPRPTVEIHLPDGRVLSGPRNAPVGAFLRLIEDPAGPPIVGAVVNGELHELTFPIVMDATVRPITMRDEDGMRIYRRSLVFLLETAFEYLFPGATLTVDYSVFSGGYHCQVSARLTLDEHDLSHLEEYMRQLVTADLPFIRQQVPLEQAIQIFQAQGEEDKVRLLVHRKKKYLTIYRLLDHLDYHHGYMLPSTGYLRWFRLGPTDQGFTLFFPHRQSPTQLLPPSDYPKLLAAFKRYGDWLHRLGIANVGALNDAIQSQRVQEVVLVSEAFHSMHLNEIAASIAERKDQIRIVLIAGPSSSGKTTFSKRLAVALLACDISPFPLEMDNYFLDRDLTPRDENGDFDFEALSAVQTERLSADLRLLIAGESVQLPRYNFITGRSEQGDVVQLQPDQMIIIEGIHGLNPNLLPGLPTDKTYRIYVSALTQLNLDRHNRVSTTDTRLIRRIVRDARERGYSAQITIQRWDSVRRGEKNYIFPYQENADVMFNSALAYELSVLKPLAEPLLRQVPHGTPEYIEAKRLLAFLEWFLPLDSDLIPDNSILREFVGRSSLHNFTLWPHPLG